jgi:hypothetical protein
MLRPELPRLVGDYAGDTLWSCAVYFGLAFMRPRTAPRVLLAFTAAISLIVELGQLWKPAWLVAIRGTLPGGLVLGSDFIWSDLLCYAVGGALAFVIDTQLRKRVLRANGVNFQAHS